MDEQRLQRILRQHVLTDHLLGADAVPVGQTAPDAPAESDDGPPMMFAVRQAASSPARQPYTPPQVNRGAADQSASQPPQRPTFSDRPRQAANPPRPVAAAPDRPDPSI